jgi:small GTP-binding protein
MNYDISLKLVVIGESGVGKSNLILRFKENRFDDDLMPTVGLDFYSEDFNIQNKRIRVQIWDTAG